MISYYSRFQEAHTVAPTRAGTPGTRSLASLAGLAKRKNGPKPRFLPRPKVAHPNTNGAELVEWI